jgi:hypothetical protein
LIPQRLHSLTRIPVLDFALIFFRQ